MRGSALFSFMTIHIPEWLLWIAGIGGGIVILLLAIVGFAVMWAFRDF